jgi:23S rRNA-/tRNA-specific pseudouridylate synthase
VSSVRIFVALFETIALQDAETRKELHILQSTVRAYMIDPAERAHVQIWHLGDNGSYVSVNKPSRMFVHRNEALARNDRIFLTDVARKQLMAVYSIYAPVFVVHRLDRATSGVLVFAI